MLSHSMPAPRIHLVPLLLLAAALQSISAERLAAQQPPVGPTLTDVKIGLGGKYKSGYWTPIWLTLKAGTQDVFGELSVVARDGENIPVRFAAENNAPLRIKAGDQARILRYAKIGPQQSTLAVELRHEGRVTFERSLEGLVPAPLGSAQELIVTLGNAVGMEEALGGTRRPADSAYATGRVDDAALLPDRWWGYEGVDCVVVTTSAGAMAEKLSSKQIDALRQWVLMGGRLVLSVGANGPRYLSEQNPWWPLIPAAAGEVAPLRETVGLESFTGTELPLVNDSGDDSDAARPAITILRQPRGRIVLEESGAATGRPLIVHSPHGLGQVTFVAFDLDHPTIARWPGRSRLLIGLLQSSQGQRDEPTGETRRSVTHLGYEDLVGQLRAALDQFKGVTVVSFTTVSILTIVYLLLLGPGDYLFLQRLHLPRLVTWITFPLAAVLFGGIAWYLGGAAHGGRMRLNQVEVIDVDAEQAIIRGTVWMHLYSPAATRHDLSLSIDESLIAAAEPVRGTLAWQGLPGAGLGGLASRQVSLSTAAPYTVMPPRETPSIEALPIQVASSKSLSSRWWGRADLKTAAELTLNEFALVEGHFTNPFPVELTECILVHNESLYRLGTIGPGQPISLADFSPLNLEWRLTERMVIDTKDQTTPWRQDSTDVPRIVQIMMFHDVARGRSYTGLAHRYQPYIDLSEHVRAGRAILVGRSSQSVSRLAIDGQPLAVDAAADQIWTYYRLVMPVSASAANTNQQP